MTCFPPGWGEVDHPFSERITWIICSSEVFRMRSPISTLRGFGLFDHQRMINILGGRKDFGLQRTFSIVIRNNSEAEAHLSFLC